MRVFGNRPLPTLHSNTRRVPFTHDGKPIGYAEPLSEDNPFRGRMKAILGMRAAMEAKRGVAVQPGVVAAAQKRSATRRGA